MMRNGRHFPLPIVASQFEATAVLGSTQVRHGWNPHIYKAPGSQRQRYPGRGETPSTAEKTRNIQFDIKSRSQWDYQRINEYLTAQSEFTKMDNRPDFSGPREASYPDIENYMYTNPPSCKPLYTYFDEYTKPGSDPKVEAAKAVVEQWDSESFYYPGEAWQRNRPGFRSVPKEMLNKYSWYRWGDYVFKSHEMQAHARPRAWNPMWPPPGYRVPKMACTRDFVFGVEEPALVHEIERYYWFKQFYETNIRHGPFEFWLWVGLFAGMYYFARYNYAYYFNQRRMFGNMWYPGRTLIRCFGEPRDGVEGWWWQGPLENKSWFPDQGLIWWFNESRFGYINYLKAEEERKRLEAVVA